ncbi:hypothetical protein WJX79_000319 [Trebouxia sp. C0005]
MADQSMGCRGAILSVTVKFISIMAMLYFSTLLTDSPENQVAGAAGDLRAMRAASSVCELIHLACLVLALVAIAVVLHRKLGPSVRTLMHSSGHQPARRRAARRTCRRDARDAALFILGIASMSVILTGSATPPLHLTHPLLSSKWGPGVHSSATASPDFAHQGSHQPLSALGRVQSSPPLRDKPVKLITEEAYPALVQLFMGSILGQVLLGVFMLALGGIILPGLCLWWEFGTISPAVGALIAPIEDPPDPMTLKIKNAGVDASKSLSRNSSLIKARHMPVMAPAPVPVISASVTNMQVVAGPELAANSGVQQASPKVQKRVTKKTKALGVLRKLVCLPPS